MSVDSQYWDDLIEALTLLRPYRTDPFPTHCEHYELWVMADANKVAPEILVKLEKLGFFVHEDGFKSFRFGSA